MSVEKIEARGWVFYVETEKEPSLHTPYKELREQQ